MQAPSCEQFKQCFKNNNVNKLLIKKFKYTVNAHPLLSLFAFYFCQDCPYFIIFPGFFKFLWYYFFSIGTEKFWAGIIPKSLFWYHDNAKCEANKHLLVNCATVSMTKLLLIVDILGVNLQNHRHMQMYNYALEYMQKHETEG